MTSNGVKMAMSLCKNARKFALLFIAILWLLGAIRPAVAVIVIDTQATNLPYARIYGAAGFYGTHQYLPKTQAGYLAWRAQGWRQQMPGTVYYYGQPLPINSMTNANSAEAYRHMQLHNHLNRANIYQRGGYK